MTIPPEFSNSDSAAGPAAAGTARLTAVASADAVVGEPQERGDRTALPLAAVSCSYGFGYGSGTREGEEGGGGGGGGHARARPVAVLEISDAALRVHQVVDTTRITLASLALAAWCVFWVARTIRAFKRR